MVKRPSVWVEVSLLRLGSGHRHPRIEGCRPPRDMLRFALQLGPWAPCPGSPTDAQRREAHRLTGSQISASLRRQWLPWRRRMPPGFTTSRLTWKRGPSAKVSNRPQGRASQGKDSAWGASRARSAATASLTSCARERSATNTASRVATTSAFSRPKPTTSRPVSSDLSRLP